MKRDAAPDTTPLAFKSGQKSSKARSSKAVFLAAFLDMSWRLIIVVLVPIVGGFKLDELWHTAPALTIIGFLLAMGGVYVVLKQTLATADDRFTHKEQHR